jgi:hypothetical protein
MIKQTFLMQFSSFEIAIGMIVIMLVFFYAGFRVRKIFIVRHKKFDGKSFGAAEGSLLGLLALLLSFTFSMSSSKHDYRLKVIVEEANDIGTAILRADLYPDSIRTAFRHDFKNYVESRIEFFAAGIDTARIYRSLETSAALQQSLWNRASSLGREQSNFHRSSQMIPALNAMIDIVTTRNAANLEKVPELIIYVLFLLCFTSAFMLGYSAGIKPDLIIITGFVLMISITVYLILDLDRPRSGTITMESVDKNIVNLRSMFDPGE